MMRSGTAESVTRRGYWIGVTTLTLVLIAVSLWAGLYAVPPQDERAGPSIENADPMAELLYSPLGMAIVLLVLQFLAANVLFWLGAWAWRMLRDGGRAST